MNKKSLSDLFSGVIFSIPDYQRGYAWEKKQWGDFVQDLDALVEEDVTSHYTGTVVVYEPAKVEARQYGSTKRLKPVDVVDGQQRLTTSSLYLSVIINKLVELGETEFQAEIPNFLYAGATCKLTLNNDTGNLFYDLLKNGRPSTEITTPHGKRLIAACDYFNSHVAAQLVLKGEDQGREYLRNLYDALTRKLAFTYYVIEDECEIGMTFELMNSRGKDLSVLELLKNYLMHWISRNAGDEHRADMTLLINKNWKDTYANLGVCNGNEDQCLRVAWTLYCTYAPKDWEGYSGFKQEKYIPLRDFSKRNKEHTRRFISHFAEGLTEVSRHYAAIIRPTQGNVLCKDEKRLLDKIRHAGNIANFLPLLVAARKLCEGERVTREHYLALLKALEVYAYRVFMWEGRRSDAGKSRLFHWGHQVFHARNSVQEVTAWVHALTREYCPEQYFLEQTASPSDWYSSRHLLKYTLFEYELHLLGSEGQGKEPLLTWSQLNDSTLEHILPQNPEEGSHWLEVWPKRDRKQCLHDIANIVLTQNNANYSNFDFTRKKGKIGVSPSYSNSDIRQERKIATYKDWTPETFEKRRTDLIAWIHARWQTEGSDEEVDVPMVEDASDEADADNPALLEAGV